MDALEATIATARAVAEAMWNALLQPVGVNVWAAFGMFWGYFSETGVNASVLVQLNAVGVTLLTAGLALNTSALGESPPAKSMTKRSAVQYRIRSSLYSSMVVFGALCLISAAFQLMDRLPEDGSEFTSTVLLICVTDLTFVGMILAAFWFIMRLATPPR